MRPYVVGTTGKVRDDRFKTRVQQVNLYRGSCSDDSRRGSPRASDAVGRYHTAAAAAAASRTGAVVV